MSNRRRQLDRLEQTLHRHAASHDLIQNELVTPSAPLTYTGSTRISADESLEVTLHNDKVLAALAAVVGSKRTAALKAAQELANFMEEPFAVWESTNGLFRTLRTDDWPDGNEWGWIATVAPQ